MSHLTVRRGLRLLQEEGLVRAIQGVGTAVMREGEEIPVRKRTTPSQRTRVEGSALEDAMRAHGMLGLANELADFGVEEDLVFALNAVPALKMPQAAEILERSRINRADSELRISGILTEMAEGVEEDLGMRFVLQERAEEWRQRGEDTMESARDAHYASFPY